MRKAVRLATLLVPAMLVLIGSSAGSSVAQAEDRSSFQVAQQGPFIRIGPLIIGPNRPQKRPRDRAEVGGKWQALGAANGTGTTICNTAGDAYACFALRCGKGRGLEFAFLFNRRDYGETPQATLRTDKGFSQVLSFSAIDRQRELVAAYDPSGHGDLLQALKDASSLEFDPGGFKHQFALRGSSKEIDRTLRACAAETGGEVLAGLGSSDSSGPVRSASTSDMRDLEWRDGDTEQSYLARIRAAAAELGGACEEDEAELQRVAPSLALTLERTSSKAGEQVKLVWSGNGLARNMPAYLVVATDSAVRFDGTGFYGLLPDALGPFGIEWSRSKSRAIVPLFGSRAARGGEIGIRPLLAGETTVEAALVGYQRSCRIETAIPLIRSSIAVEPAEPRIVLNSDPIAVTYDRFVDVTAFNRKVELSKDRYLITDASEGSEIAERPGRDLRISPTGRFVIAQADGGYEIVDIVDGAVLANVAGVDVGWINHDSFVASGSGMWGVTTIAELARGRVLVRDIRTACAACSSANSAGVAIDLENGVSIAVGHLGYSYVDLAGVLDLNDPYTVKSSETFAEQKSALKSMASEIGVVMPLNLPRSWNAPGGLRFTHFSEARTTGRSFDADNARLAGLVQEFVAAPKQEKASATAAVATEPSTQVLRSIDAVAAVDTDRSMTSLAPVSGQLAEFGLALSRRIPGEVLLDHSANIGFEETRGAELESQAAAARAAISADLSAVGHELAWGEDDGSLAGLYCEHFSDEVGGSTMGADLDYAARFAFGGKPVWVVRATCTGGATLGSQLWKSYLAVVDAARVRPDQPSGQFIVETGGDWGGTFQDCNAAFFECDLTVRATAAKYLLIHSAQRRAIALFDLETREYAFKQTNVARGDLMVDTALAADMRHIVQLNRDGSFFVHRVADAATVLEGRVVDDEVVVWTPDMRFDSTAEGAHFVNLRFPGQPGQYTFQQFDSRLRVPGLVEKVLSGTYEPQPVEVGVPPRLAGSLEAKDGRIAGSVTPESLGKLRGVRVYQDGILTNEILALVSGDPVAIDVPRMPGARWVSLVAVDEEGLVSLPVGRDLGTDAGSLASVRLLAVGVDQYDSEGIADLALARTDALSLRDSLKAVSGKSVDLVDEKVLADHDASPQAVLAAAERLVAEAKPGELAVFFFAGHGVKGEDGRYYMATSATDPGNISGTALSWDALSAVLAKSTARMAVFLDSCHSGAAGTDFFATNDEAAAGILKNIPSGLTVFSASKGRELSEENAAVGGGVFTKAITEVIAGNRAAYDTNANGAIEVSELYVGVKRQVVEGTASRQTPWLARNQMVGDFALF